MNGNVIRTITIRGTSEGLDKLQTDLTKLAAAHKDVAIAAEETDKKTISLEQAWKRQTLRLDEAARAQANVARETKIADQALREGLATQAQHAQRLELINQRYTATTTATKTFGQQTGLARHELINLSRQVQDVGVSLASGQSPLTVLVQQGTQIADVFATTGGSMRGFFSQAVGWAKTFFTSTTGIVTGVLAAGAAAVYVASQFMSSSKTIEEVLKEQNRLLKEGKTLIDARASVEDKFNAQPPNVTRFESLRNELEVAKKLKEMSESLQSKVTTPSSLGMPEMGIAPDVSTAAAPGMEKVRAEIENLVQSITEGKPKVTEFVDALARIAIANPELAKTTEEIIKMGGPALEQAVFKARALEDALKGVATAAQLAALGYASLAQFQVGNQMAKEAAAAAERQAIATQQISAAYPGMSIEVAKQLNALQQQLPVIQARTGAEQMVKQEIATQNTLLAQGKTQEEAIAIAAAQRAASQAQIDKGARNQIKALEDQVELIKAARNGTEDQAKAAQVYRNAIADGVNPALAEQLATMTEIVAKEREADAAVRRRAQANQEAINAINAQNAYLAQQEAIYNEIEASIGHSVAMLADFDPASGRITIQRFGSSQIWTNASGGYTQFNPAGYQSGGAMDIGAQLGSTQSGGFDLAGWQIAQAREAKKMEAIYGPGGFTSSEPGTPLRFTPTSAGLAFQLEQTINSILGRSGSLMEAFNTSLTQVGGGLQEAIQPMQQLIDLAPKDQQASMIGAAIEAVSRQPATLAREQLLKQLTDKMEGLASSTDALNATMQSALSPYYSQDPRTTKLGFRAGVVGNPDWLTGATNATALDAILGPGATAPGMAGGGSFIVGGGYSSIDNKVARFPVASGEQVVVNRRPGGQATVVNNDNRIVINGNVDQDTLSKMKVSRFQQAQRMRSMTAA